MAKVTHICSAVPKSSMGILYITVFIFIIIIGTLSLSQVYALPTIYDDDYIYEKFVDGLNGPVAMAFVGDDILVLEKNTGKIFRIQDNGTPYTEPVLDVTVSSYWEGGLLGISSISNHVFLYFTESKSSFDMECKHGIQSLVCQPPDQFVNNRVYRYNWNGENLIDPILIKEFSATPDGMHYGGTMTEGKNNEIYFVIGDLRFSETHNGGIFQNMISSDNITESGSIFKIDTENNNVELYAMGIRNSFGLAVDPVTGHLWDTENGITKYDEINLVKQRFNSGWEVVMGPADRNYSVTGENLMIDNVMVSRSSYTKVTIPSFENFEYSDPEFSWYKPVGPTAIAFPDKDSFRKYADWLFVGDFNNGMIYKFQLNSDRTEFVFSNPDLSDLVLDDNNEIDDIIFARDFQGVTDIKFHDGAMYVISIGDGSIYKIYPKNILSPLKQHQNGIPTKNIACMPSLMPIMNKSGSIYCVYPKTALTLINVLNWNIDHLEMPKIELMFQDLSGLNFEYNNLSNSDLRRAEFDTAKISNVNFTNANLSHVDLSDHNLTGTILTGADLTGANLDGVDLSGKDLTGTILAGVDLSGKDLTDTILSGSYLTGANLDGVDLSDQDLSNANLTRVDLSGKDLTDAILTGAKLTGADLSNANLTRVDLSGQDLSYADLTGVDLSNKDLTGTILTGADLTDATLNCFGHPICVS